MVARGVEGWEVVARGVGGWEVVARPQAQALLGCSAAGCVAAVMVVTERGPAAWTEEGTQQVAEGAGLATQEAGVKQAQAEEAMGRDSQSTAPGCATAPGLEGVRQEVEKGAEVREASAEEVAETDAAAEAGPVKADAAMAVGDLAAEGI